MVKSLSSDISNLSSYCSIKSLQKRDALRLQQNKALEDKSIVGKFMRKKDLPGWYRGLSGKQLHAANSLLDNIRDDTEQGTSHRCRYALLILGLYPLESSHNIKLILKLCRGNDLAFLWFLMDLFYKDTCDECLHAKTEFNVNQQLIMTTIAHLDMVTTIRELDKIVPKQPKLKKPKVPIPAKKEKIVYASPYLEPLPKPIILDSFKKRPPFIKPPSLEPYCIYKDPTYVVRNEANRWYALPEEEHDELDTTVKIDTSGPKIIQRILRSLIKAVCMETIDREKVFTALCQRHKLLKEKEKELEKVEEIVKREQFNKHFNLKDKKKVRAKRISKLIEADAKQYYDKCQREKETDEIHTWVKILIDELIDKAEETVPTGPACSESTPCPANNEIYKDIKDPPQCGCYLEYPYYDYGHFGTPKPNEIYFHAPRKYKPYIFHYDKIFNNDLGKDDPVKRAVYCALDLHDHADEDEAIKDWIKESWIKQVRKFNKEYEKKSELKIEEEEQQRYNPRDDELMDSMLTKAIKTLRENPKFVLATLPDAHKHPMLKEWIRQRYGLVYTKKERKEAMKVSRSIFEAMRRRKLRLKSPMQEDIGIEKVVSYVCRNYVYHKSNRILATFFHNLKMHILEDTKVYWMAMEPFHSHKGAPRDTFYSYMPSREYDVMPFRPWHSHEYMEAAKEWEQRVKIRKAEEEARI